MTVDFVAKLCGSDAKNSVDESSIEKFMTKLFFDKLEEDKREPVASLRSQRDCSSNSNASRLRF